MLVNEEIVTFQIAMDDQRIRIVQVAHAFGCVDHDSSQSGPGQEIFGIWRIWLIRFVYAALTS